LRSYGILWKNPDLMQTVPDDGEIDLVTHEPTVTAGKRRNIKSNMFSRNCLSLRLDIESIIV
jgi:hypothetical protein